MKLPYILLVDDDPQVLGAIQRDMKSHYREDYRVVAASSGAEAMEVVHELKLKNEALALIVSDQKMPEMDGVTFLETARGVYNGAKQVLLTAYSDTDAAIRAINQVKLDYYLLKPWNPPEERLYPVINDLLDEWHSGYRPDHEGLRIVGFQWSPKSHRLKEFLSGNLVPFVWMDVENHSEAEQYMNSAGITHAALPLVVLKDGTALVDPDLSSLASAIGLRQKPTQEMYDVMIIGAGPAGLAASVYGSCEGLKTLLIEKSNPGGQAGSSARIENYLGFPAGLSGGELTRRAIAQTLRFGTEILTPQEVKNIAVKDGYKIVELADGTLIHTKSVVIATGVAYARLGVPGIEKFTGSGVYYGSASVEAHACRDGEVYIVGGGNSACQAAMHLCQFAKNVHILIRRDALKQTAANYLVQNISQVPNIHIHPHTEVAAVHGDVVLEKITLKDSVSDEQRTVDAKALFVYIGTRPGTGWLNDLLLKDEKGYILTGQELMRDKSYSSTWKLQREPYLPESSVPGIFASGDVRAGALAGISSAVGEGAMAIRFVRKYLQEM